VSKSEDCPEIFYREYLLQWNEFVRQNDPNLRTGKDQDSEANLRHPCIPGNSSPCCKAFTRKLTENLRASLRIMSYSQVNLL
jgi:hypothetical protein